MRRILAVAAGWSVLAPLVCFSEHASPSIVRSSLERRGLSGTVASASFDSDRWRGQGGTIVSQVSLKARRSPPDSARSHTLRNFTFFRLSRMPRIRAHERNRCNLLPGAWHQLDENRSQVVVVSSKGFSGHHSSSERIYRSFGRGKSKN